jgi:methenyltetrahydrofolate cyclohydrolase
MAITKEERMKKYADKSIKYYLNQLAAKSPAPGGGSSSALIAAIGCGLLSMVANFTLSDKGFNGYKKRAEKAFKKCEALRIKLTALIDRDIIAYEKLSGIFKKHDIDSIKLQTALKKAVIPPLRVCDYSYRAAEAALEISYMGKKSILSDVAVAIYALDSAFESGLENIRINLKHIKDKQYASDKSKKYTLLHKNMKYLKTQILSKARERMYQ